ncbi:glyoxalase [Amylibacter kogurei]|uniref:Glyoxalase n=1 Tax=Paramylibacter kogurei TaxID=1889778 RepID=A0A2G5K5Q1_9RHOB|nr:VOC family protein [Amylibacter kogurei]PIB24861.1 glyoxalase [Amylibacter kogurei]
MADTYQIPAKTTVGHVHLKVANIDRALAFYQNLLGFEITTRLGDDAVFLSAGGYHHHIALNTWFSRDQPAAPKRSAGLFHLALLYPTRKDLAQILKRLLDHGYQLDGVSDHGVSEALYLRDPDENGVELYWDRPRNEWPRDGDGQLQMVTERLDLDALLALA